MGLLRYWHFRTFSGCVTASSHIHGEHSAWIKASRKLLVNHGCCNRRGVSTLSPLAAAFNAKPQRKLNLSLRRSNAGLFLIPELQDYAGFYLLQEKVKTEVEQLVQEAVSHQRTRKMVNIFDDLSDCLCQVADIADFVRMAHPDRRYSEAAEDTCVKLSSLVETLNTNTAIHSALKHVLDHGDVMAMDEVDKRVSELFMFDFEQSGIHLEEGKIATVDVLRQASSEGVIIVDEGLVLHHLLCPPAGVTTEETLV
ncbi:hypothetical protein BaRGS_00031638 [Batillaria attramentaria]|uniref:Mitochondrial intermediate peptidase n=1 Tax=Batillaria attramentaria TaxID=370345 RepID=A0ABD0JR36_9CAEN